jgi:hypothetical protein
VCTRRLLPYDLSLLADDIHDHTVDLSTNMSTIFQALEWEP